MPIVHFQQLHCWRPLLERRGLLGQQGTSHYAEFRLILMNCFVPQPLPRQTSRAPLSARRSPSASRIFLASFAAAPQKSICLCDFFVACLHTACRLVCAACLHASFPDWQLLVFPMVYCRLHPPIFPLLGALAQVWHLGDWAAQLAWVVFDAKRAFLLLALCSPRRSLARPRYSS